MATSSLRSQLEAAAGGLPPVENTSLRSRLEADPAANPQSLRSQLEATGAAEPPAMSLRSQLESMPQTPPTSTVPGPTAAPLSESAAPSLRQQLEEQTATHAISAPSMEEPGRVPSQEEQDYAKTDPTKMEDQPWYSKAWEWLNSPILGLDPHKLGTTEGSSDFVKGIETGLEDIGAGFLSPLQLGLMITTFGGSAVESTAVGALKALGVGVREAGITIKAAKALTEGAFTVDMVRGMMTQSPQFLDALKDGDVEEATRLGTNLLASGVFLHQAMKHGIEDFKAAKKMRNGTTTDQLSLAAEAEENHGANVQMAADKARDLNEKLNTQFEQLKMKGDKTKQTAAMILTANYDGDAFDTDRIGKMRQILDGTLKPLPQSPMPSHYFDPETKSILPNKDHVYTAVDRRYRDQVLNSGIKNIRRGEQTYYDTAQEALDNGTLPHSGTKDDLEVYAVPRAEVEQGVREYNAAKEKRAPGNEPVTDLTTDKSHMPGHLLERDDNGNFTGQATPLRPQGAEDLPGDVSRFLNKFTDGRRKEILDAFRLASNPTPELMEAAKTLRGVYDNSFTRAHQHGLIRQWVEAYHPQAWADRPNSFWTKVFGQDPQDVTKDTYNSLRHDTESGKFDTEINSAKHRVYQTMFHGLLAGEDFEHVDLAKHASDHIQAIEHAIADQAFLDELMRKGGAAADGRPAVVMQGSARVIGEETGNPAVAVEPKQVRSININPETVRDMQIRDPRTGQIPLEEALRNKTIVPLPWTVEIEEHGQMVKMPAYAWNSDGYVFPDHRAMRGWGYAGQDTAGNPVLNHGNIGVHPDFEQVVRRTLGAESSVFRKSAVLRGLGAVGSEGKGFLLFGSPFHVVQEALRGVMMGVNPFKWDHIDSNTNPVLQDGYRAGLIGNDFHAKDGFSTGYAGHSKLIAKLPVLRNWQNAMQSFLFEKYIPSLKERAFLKLMEQTRAKEPGLSQMEAARKVAPAINDVFGGQNWKRLGVTLGQQDLMRTFALAPDWLVSEMRMLGRAAGVIGDKTTGNLLRNKMAIQLGSLWLTARVLNMLTTGNMHNEAPFGLAHKNDKGDETIYSVRTLPTDILHAISAPDSFIRSRVSPLVVRPAVEFLTGRDDKGRRATTETQLKDVVKGTAPIFAQGIWNSNELNMGEQLTKFGGLATSIYKTEAERLARQYASDHMPSGPVSPENLKKHQQDIRLEEGIRNGTVSRGEVLREVGQRRMDEIVRRAPMSALQSYFDRLPLSEAVNVWEAATPKEKDELSATLWKKRVTYIKDHTPAQRADDPTWIKLQKIMADLRR